MKCRQFKRAIKSLVCGEKADAQAVHEHLSKCSRCAEKYAHVLTIIRSAKTAPVAPADADTWKELSAQLHRRIREEHPAPLGWLRSLVLSVGEWRLIRFRKAVAASVATLALIFGVTVFLNPPVPESPEPEVARTEPVPTEMPLPGLPPDMEDVISIFGPEGFKTGAELGLIGPGDYFQGHRIEQYEFYEALDFLYTRS